MVSKARAFSAFVSQLIIKNATAADQLTGIWGQWKRHRWSTAVEVYCTTIPVMLYADLIQWNTNTPKPTRFWESRFFFSFYIISFSHVGLNWRCAARTEHRQGEHNPRVLNYIQGVSSNTLKNSQSLPVAGSPIPANEPVHPKRRTPPAQKLKCTIDQLIKFPQPSP